MGIKPNCLKHTAWLLYTIPTFYFLHSLIVEQRHDWDLDSFLYLGSRLSQGDLLYFRDFEMKLPMVQYLFWIPYILGGIGAWRVITFVTCLVSGVLSSHLIIQSLAKPDVEGPLQRTAAVIPLAGSVFLIFLYSLPGSSSAQLSAFSAALIYLAIAIWHQAIKSKRDVVVLFAGAAAALAACIRPNYLYAVPAFALLATQNSNSDRFARFKSLAIFALSFSTVFGFQFVPYLFVDGGIPVLVSGIRALSQFSHGSWEETFKTQFFKETASFYFFFAICIGFSFLQLLRNYSALNNYITFRGSLFCLFSILGLQSSTLATHYHPHYSMMYVPYAALLFTYLLTSVVSKDETSVWQPLTILVLLSWYTSVMITPLWRLKNSEVNFSINERNSDPTMTAIITKLISNGLSFYVPRNTNYHRLFSESRIGDGHPSMLTRILKGRRVGPVGEIFLYSDRVHKTPCLALWDSNKDVVIMEALDQRSNSGRHITQEVLSCLNQADSGYREIKNSGKHRVFARRPSFVVKILKSREDSR